MWFFRDQAQGFLEPHLYLPGAFVWHDSTISSDFGAKSFFDAKGDVNHQMTVVNQSLITLRPHPKGYVGTNLDLNYPSAIGIRVANGPGYEDPLMVAAPLRPWQELSGMPALAAGFRLRLRFHLGA